MSNTFPYFKISLYVGADGLGIDVNAIRFYAQS